MGYLNKFLKPFKVDGRLGIVTVITEIFVRVFIDEIY